MMMMILMMKKLWHQWHWKVQFLSVQSAHWAAKWLWHAHSYGHRLKQETHTAWNVHSKEDSQAVVCTNFATEFEAADFAFFVF